MAISLPDHEEVTACSLCSLAWSKRGDMTSPMSKEIYTNFNIWYGLDINNVFKCNICLNEFDNLKKNEIMIKAKTQGLNIYTKLTWSINWEIWYQRYVKENQMSNSDCTLSMYCGIWDKNGKAQSSRCGQLRSRLVNNSRRRRSSSSITETRFMIAVSGDCDFICYPSFTSLLSVHTKQTPLSIYFQWRARFS